MYIIGKKKRGIASVIMIAGFGVTAFIITLSLGVMIGLYNVQLQKAALLSLTAEAPRGEVAISQITASQPTKAQVILEKSAAPLVATSAPAGVQVQAPSVPIFVDKKEKEMAGAVGAALKKGEGVEHTLIRQLRERHKDKDLQWAQRRAHKIAGLAGLVGPDGEIRVKNGANIKKGVAYVLDEDESQIITVFDGQEVRRTPIATDLAHVQPVAPLPFEYVHHQPT